MATQEQFKIKAIMSLSYLILFSFLGFYLLIAQPEQRASVSDSIKDMNSNHTFYNLNTNQRIR